MVVDIELSVLRIVSGLGLGHCDLSLGLGYYHLGLGFMHQDLGRPWSSPVRVSGSAADETPSRPDARQSPTSFVKDRNHLNSLIKRSQNSQDFSGSCKQWRCLLRASRVGTGRGSVWATSRVFRLHFTALPRTPSYRPAGTATTRGPGTAVCRAGANERKQVNKIKSSFFAQMKWIGHIL